MNGSDKLHGWIGVDLDGTLAAYDGWKGAENIGEPVPLMLGRVQRWLAAGNDVRIFTARVSSDGSPHRDADAARALLAIQAWSLQHVGTALPVTNVKDYAMAELWDDRAVQVEENTGIVMGKSRRGL